MEGKGKMGSSSSSSSFTTQLFGPKGPSSTSNFNSIFPPPSKGQSKESATCNLSSSLYYGGQDVYSRSTHNHTYPNVNQAQPRDDGDASRGNWWQGSLYY